MQTLYPDSDNRALSLRAAANEDRTAARQTCVTSAKVTRVSSPGAGVAPQGVAPKAEVGLFACRVRRASCAAARECLMRYVQKLRKRFAASIRGSSARLDGSLTRVSADHVTASKVCRTEAVRNRERVPYTCASP
jgi:hypothetical protein